MAEITAKTGTSAENRGSAGDRWRPRDAMQSRNFAVHEDLPIKSFARSMSPYVFHRWPDHSQIFEDRDFREHSTDDGGTENASGAGAGTVGEPFWKNLGFPDCSFARVNDAYGFLEPWSA